ncbi:hypothetical protein BSM4216_2777 [Bacillus smithii]|nr:hypothetical protein BSM4216_2777 [Bacillus smithii]
MNFYKWSGEVCLHEERNIRFRQAIIEKHHSVSRPPKGSIGFF